MHDKEKKPAHKNTKKIWDWASQAALSFSETETRRLNLCFFFFRFILCFWFYLSWLSRGGNFVHRFSVENLQARRAVAFRFKNRIVNRENSKRKNKNKIACHACAAHHRVCANWPMSESIAIGFLQYIITINYDGMQSGLFLIIRSVQRKGTKGELSWCNTARMRIVHIAIVII